MPTLHSPRRRRVALTIGAVLAVVAATVAPASGSVAADQQGTQLLARIQAGQLKCQQLSRDQSMAIGEDVMGRMLGSPARHAAMDKHLQNAAGPAGEAQAHVFMGQRFAGCPTGAAPAAFGSMMGMMGTYSGATGMGMGDGGNAYPTGMIGGSGSHGGIEFDWSATDTVLIVLLAAAAAALVALRPRRRTLPRPSA